jgi:hypothetical protein
MRFLPAAFTVPAFLRLHQTNTPLPDRKRIASILLDGFNKKSAENKIIFLLSFNSFA